MSQIIEIGPRKFEIHHVFGLGWKVLDVHSGNEVRSDARNGLWSSKYEAIRAARALVTKIYGKEISK